MKEKQMMSDALYKSYIEKYNNQSFEERKQEYIKDMCRYCRYNYSCDKEIIPENILMPSKSDKAWVPPRTACSDFEWS